MNAPEDNPADDTPPDMGDFNKVGPLDMSNLSPGEVMAALKWDDATQQAWQKSMAHIAMGIQSNHDTKTQVATMLSIIGNTARSLGMVLTLA